MFKVRDYVFTSRFLDWFNPSVYKVSRYKTYGFQVWWQKNTDTNHLRSKPAVKTNLKTREHELSSQIVWTFVIMIRNTTEIISRDLQVVSQTIC